VTGDGHDRDHLGEFLAQYDEYLDRRRSYDDLPAFEPGGNKMHGIRVTSEPMPTPRQPTPRQLTERDERHYATAMLAGGAAIWVLAWVLAWLTLGIPGVIVVFGVCVLVLAAAARAVDA
jgi:hypothetical protein